MRMSVLGSVMNPYRISEPEELYGFAQLVRWANKGRISYARYDSYTDQSYLWIDPSSSPLAFSRAYTQGKNLRSAYWSSPRLYQDSVVDRLFDSMWEDWSHYTESVSPLWLNHLRSNIRMCVAAATGTRTTPCSEGSIDGGLWLGHVTSRFYHNHPRCVVQAMHVGDIEQAETGSDGHGWMASIKRDIASNMWCKSEFAAQLQALEWLATYCASLHALMYHVCKEELPFEDSLQLIDQWYDRIQGRYVGFNGAWRQDRSPNNRD